RPPLRLHAHALPVAREMDDALLLPQLDAPVARRPGQLRVELSAPDHLAETVAGHRDGAAGNADRGGVDARVRDRERDAERLEHPERLRDDTARAGLVAR